VPVDLIASKSGYHSDTLFVVGIVAGDTVIANIQLLPQSSNFGSIAGIVSRADNSLPIPSATITALQAGYVIAADTSDINGQYNLNGLVPGVYELITDQDSYFPDTTSGVAVVADSVTIANITLAQLDYVRGDVNCNNVLNGLDVIFMVNFFKGGPPPCPPIVRGDVNGNCVFNGLDVGYLVNYLKGGPPPVIVQCP